MESSSESASISPDTPILDNSGDLRFPTPDADSRITSWVQNITRKKMAYDSDDIFDEGSLGGSAYELIDTDDESRDDNATESVSSTDYDRSDDITSLVNTEYNEDGCEENTENTCDPTFLDSKVEDAFNSPTIDIHQVSVGKIEVPLFLDFEFDEYFDEKNDTISVKHTVAELDEEQASNALSLIQFDHLPKSVVLSVRQTMTKQSLSTNYPLRIFYVGNSSAKQEIIHKIASTINISVDNARMDQQRRHLGSQHSNVVPISAFGSERAPEIEHMHSSRYQIEVDSCNSAQNIKCKDDLGFPDLIKIVLDDQRVCYSIPSGKDYFAVETDWLPPDITVIYLSDDDDMTIRNSMITVAEFIERHDIPSIVISQNLMLDFSLLPLDQDSIHLCLESRDPIKGEDIIHRRLPIDLASFLNVDARQMNRNLAYITGLYEPLEDLITSKPKKIKKNTPDKNHSYIKKIDFFSWDQASSILRFAFSYRVYLLGFLIAIMTVISTYNTISGPSILVNNKSVSTFSKLPKAARHGILDHQILITSSTHKPLEMSAKDMSGTYFFSSSPDEEFYSSSGKSKQDRTFSKTQKSSALFVCTAELYTDQEIIVRISGRINLSLPKNEVISFSVLRDNNKIDIRQAYSSGIVTLLFISKKEAHGTVDISIKTLKNSAVLNENCALDFGPSATHVWQLLKNKMSSIIPDEYVDVSYLDHIRQAINVTDNLITESWVSLSRMNNFYNKTINLVILASDTLNDTATMISSATIKKFAIYTKDAPMKLSRSTRMLKKFKKLFYKKYFLAQSRSKILWLKLKGMEKEAKQYYERAFAFKRNKQRRK
ncbi:hypothetical protein GcM1_233067 [Golovinomyces cichoracearum]|uniref:Uncharacterized protein n=1 Tax=Golovinomyces cichoracearum TaxID=62708 RepID=A0A420IM05_9PEZI|nr:hypothetical protein GcM1_233067 [Golovinomyces cichoracearum]